MSFNKSITLQEAKFIIETLRIVHKKFINHIKIDDCKNPDGIFYDDDDIMLIFANELAELIFRFTVLMKKKFGKHIYLPL